MNLILRLRNRHFFVLDVLALLFIPALALTLRLDRLDWWPRFSGSVAFFTMVALVLKVLVFHRLGLYRRYWRYAGVSDLTQVLLAVGLSTTMLTAVFVAAQGILAHFDLAVPRTLPFLDGILTGLAVGGSRIGLRGLYHRLRERNGVIGGRRVLVVGAGEAGTMVVREMRANPQLNMEPVAFVDDDPVKAGTRIQDLPVLGASQQIPELIDRCKIRHIIVAVPSAPFQRQREIVDICKRTGVYTYNLPGIYELLAGCKTISRLPQVDVNRLLHRKPVEIDQMELAACLDGRKVLVTGAGGSIGSELCRQIARLEPRGLILLGHGENSIFEVGLDLQLSFPDLVTHQVIADVRDRERVERVIAEHCPSIIFHAAAHKHVPFMESDFEEALTNNVLGTWNVLQAAERHGVERFVLISTDKAVHPANVMGATKRLAELLTVAFAKRSRRAYMAVRFGNVLGSRGSVICVFQRQIAAGGPLTVTHPDMRRYFMTIPEAVQLVLQASALGQGGEVFVLDMGQPVRIVDLATDLIKLSGLEPGRDIRIMYTGTRPGEKLSEELFLEEEDCRPTKYPKILMATCRSTVEPEILQHLAIELVHLARRTHSQNAADKMRGLLSEICYYIDSYRPCAQPLLPEPSAVSVSSPAVPAEPRPEDGSPWLKPAVV
jgi:FlaA1/EpsC-like NDP-sugar epimerase